MAIGEKTVNAVTNGSEAGTPAPRPNDERYDAQRVETKWFERWQQDADALRRRSNLRRRPLD